MRDESHFDYVEAHADAPARVALWRGVASAALSLAAVAALVVWAYRLGMRDANDVPVIRAMEGPARIRPEDPGGARFDHQGRAVYGALRGEEPPETASETASLAPAPEPLAEEDRAPAILEAAVESPPLDAEESVAPSPGAFVAAVDQIVREAIAEDAAARRAEIALVDPTPRAPVTSPVAPPRPGSEAARVAAAAPAAEAPPAAGYADDAAAPPVPAGPSAPLIQLGAYYTEETALAMWSEIRRRNGDLLAGLDPTLAAIRQEGEDLVLLRAGPFDSVDEARAFCATMRGRDEDCLTVGPR